MHIAIINDCHDDNVVGRQLARVASLLPGASVSFSGVGDYADLAAAGNLIDVLDAFEDREGAILVNVAPRHKEAKKWPNGTPFGYFRYNNVLVVASIDGLTLSLIKKLGLVEAITVMDIPTAASEMVKNGFITEEIAGYLSKTQFRSFDFVPRAAAYLLSGKSLQGTTLPLSEVADAPRAAWWVDNFGNVKTTMLPGEVGFEPGKDISFGTQTFNCFERLKDVPDATPALIIGSSGIGEQRFLEIVVQGRRASDTFNLGIGSILG